MTSPPSNEPRVTDGRSPLWRGHNVFRVVTLLYASAWVAFQFHAYARPWLAVVVISLMGVWTAFTVWRYSTRAGRTNLLVALDQVVVTVLFLSNEFILTEQQMAESWPTVVTAWHPTMTTAAAAQWGIPGGVASGVFAAGCNFLLRWKTTPDMVLDTVLLIGVGAVIGLASDSARRTTARLARALRAEAATAERERLARDIHDSVLQVLARVRRRGAELGGEAAELAKLAGEQEIALRALVATTPQEPSENGETDLAARLQVLRTGRVHVSVPGTPVLLGEPLCSELFAAVREALANVDKHAGPDAQAWVLLEELPDEVVISVRDDGPGIPEGRLDEAAAEGRLGVAKSIRGRVEGLGGTITLDTEPGEGTEWEIRVPLPVAKPAKRRRGGER
ncbi:MacS family sensor histidine kinase [Saccharopolyspora hordei]|uniref:Signal transduction histidine kinase n=1 Tax=Saccharopolyspora hordei TaxID=1838 RepID=A0A853ACB4_9PSEU|nr:signal transduction histidine kinase [Saccharopolyspora hordei]